MNWRHYVFLFLVGLIVPFTISRFQSLPGYMDADYYYAGGIQLAAGRGFTEPYIWNYLGDPQGLPTPSHTYWMPLASIVSAAGMWIAGSTSYEAGRIPFILLSACVPLLTATLAYSLSRKTLPAMVSGLLSVFALYYSPFMPVPDNFAIFMLLGGTFLLLAPCPQKWIPLMLGALSGLMTLARSDGLLWLGLAGLIVMWKAAYKEDGTKNTFLDWFNLIVPSGLLAVLGYLLVMGPWHGRNLNLFGSFMTPGGGRLLWLENYDQTFAYPAETITREGFLNAGWKAALQDRLAAFDSNFRNAVGAQGELFLIPFIMIGLWHLRNDMRTKITVTGWLLLFAVMTVIFPFAGSRGSFFHSGAAFQPYWWAVAPIGMDILLDVGYEKKKITDPNLRIVTQVSLVLIAFIATFYLVFDHTIEGGGKKEDAVYPSVEDKLLDSGISPNDVVIVRNPPGYYISTGRSAIVLPFGGESAILTVAEKFGARYLIIEKGGTYDGIQDLYDDPRGNPSFEFLGEVDGARLYQITNAP
ncbi:MAG: hypothetical protein HXY35_03295 [Chloroflexi bacterium]|nr:hypothetical protein [Chloroflexota bacterium]